MRISSWNLCTCAQSHALGTHTKFQLEILTVNVISGIVYFREIILESSRNVCETTPSILTFISWQLTYWCPLKVHHTPWEKLITNLIRKSKDPIYENWWYWVCKSNLTHCGLIRHIATEIWVNIGSGNGLLPDGTKPLPERMLSNHQRSCGICLRAISQEMRQISVFNKNLKITDLKL